MGFRTHRWAPLTTKTFVGLVLLRVCKIPLGRIIEVCLTLISFYSKLVSAY